MFERFTDHARKVMTMANQDAKRFNHEYIGTEHILLGLVKMASGKAVDILKNLDCEPRSIRVEVEKIVVPICQQVDRTELPQTPRAKFVVMHAIEEMQNLHQTIVGTEHILLGLLRQHGSFAAEILVNLGLDLEQVRDEARRLADAEEE